MQNYKVNALIGQLHQKTAAGELGHSIVPLLAELATLLESSGNARCLDDARRVRNGIQNINRGGCYGGFVPDYV